MSPRRADLLALTPDALAELTNRGLVKRAARTVDEGAGPAVSVLDDGSVAGVFPDGVETTLPVGGLDAGRCGCGAAGVCRHVLAVVLAYQAREGSGPSGGLDQSGTPGSGAAAGPTAPEFEDWSPGGFSDEALGALLGTRMLTTARRRLAEGFVARVHRAEAVEPVPYVELPACTVRFLVPRDLGYARSDVGSGAGPEIALAVWAWRAWQEAGSPEGHFAVGGGKAAVSGGAGAGTGVAVGAGIGTDPAEASGGAAGGNDEAGSAERSTGGESGKPAGSGTRGPESGGSGSVGSGSGASSSGTPATIAAPGGSAPALDAAVDLAREVLLTGVSQLGAGLGPELARVRRDLATAGFRWPLLAVEDLAEQIEAYEARSAVHQSERVADLLAELAARRRAASWDGGSPRARILGTEEAAETSVRLIRLTGLGCRIEAFGEERRLRVFLAESSSGTVLTLHHRWAPEQAAAADGPALGMRRLAGSTVRELAVGAIVTESARRGADRRVRLATSRVGRTTVSPGSGNWDALPQRLLIRDLAAAAAEFERLPPRLIRPRIEAEDVRVVEVGGVEHVRYLPGAQRLEARLAGVGGGSVTVVAEYRGVVPGALDALAGALEAKPRFVSGTVRRGRNGLEVTPLAVATAGAIVVPDLAMPHPNAPLVDSGWSEAVDRTSAALASARGLLGEVAHRGARHLPPSFGERLDSAAQALDRTGLGRCAADLRELARTLWPAPEREAFQAWTAATVRIVTAIEAR